MIVDTQCKRIAKNVVEKGICKCWAGGGGANAKGGSKGGIPL